MKKSCLVLALSLVAAAAMAAPASAQDVPTVAVVGSQTEMVANDTASVALGAAASRSSKPAALSALSKTTRRIINRTKAAGSIANPEISTRRIQVSKRLIRNRDRQVVGRRFIARTHVDLIVLRVKRTGAVVAAGVGAGADHVDGPRYYVLDSDDRYQDALLKAFDKAKAKARALATRSGRTLGAVRSIVEGGGVFSIFDSDDSVFAPTSAGLADLPPVRAGKSRVTGVVSVVFEMS